MRYKIWTVIWMAVTSDKYELPIVWANTAEELSRMMGVSRNNMVSGMHHGGSGHYKGWKPVRVEVGE